MITTAVQEINRLHVAKGLEAARTLGEYLLTTFFGGDLQAFTAREKKHASFRALAKRDDLIPTHTSLWYSVALLGQLRQLPADIAGALPLSHHKLLIPVRDEKLKLELAEAAVENHLNKEDLDARIRAVREEQQGDGKRAGRPALPGWAKGIGGIAKSVQAALADEISGETVTTYRPAVAKKRLDEVDTALAMLGELRAKLTQAIAAAK
jgi:hypothetical protein